jgi:E3 ubiquitin-protein ligase RAD18
MEALGENGVLLYGLFVLISLPSSQLPTKVPSETPQYLGFLNYAMLKDLQLRKKLKDQGIPNDGSRQILEKRYTYWINLYNSNCDAKSPRNRRELLRELAVWEKSQFGYSASSDRDGVMAKDFDGDGWNGRHKDQFQDLIEQARAKAKLVKVAGDEKASRGDPVEGKEYSGVIVQPDDVPPPFQSIPHEEPDDVHHIPSRDEREIPDSDDELYRDRTPPVGTMIKTPSKQEMTMPVFRVQEDA